MPVGKPAPPRPRSPESLTAWMIASGSMRERLAQRLVPAVAVVALEGEGVRLVPVGGEDRGEGGHSDVLLRAAPSSPSPWRAAGPRSEAPPADGPSPARPSGRPASTREASLNVHSRFGPRVGAHRLAGAQVVDELLGRLRGLLVEELPVDHDHRGEVAGGVALQPLQRDLAVGRGLVVAHAEVLRQRLPDLVAAHHRAQRVDAHAHVVLAGRLALVHRVEGGHADDLGLGHAEHLGAELVPASET